MPGRCNAAHWCQSVLHVLGVEGSAISDQNLFLSLPSNIWVSRTALQVNINSGGGAGT